MVLHKDSTEIDPAQWQDLVDNSPVSGFFQTPECYGFYRSLSFLEPFVTGVSEEGVLKGVICGYLISEGNTLKRFFSRRAIVPGGALLSATISDEAVQALFAETARALRQRAIYIEVRNYNNYNAYRDTVELAGFSYQPHLNIHVPVTDLSATLKHLSESKRRQLKQSQKAGVQWAETTDPEEIRQFYRLLEQLYKQKVKTPLFPVEFFEKLVQLPSGRLLVVRSDGKVTGGMACVMLQRRVLYEWFVCGDENSGCGMYPSVVATWAGIEYASRHEIPLFDFMGAGKPGKDYGVRGFKSKFGGKIVEQGRFLYICNPLLYRFGKGMVKVLKYFA